jgi:hypothetical protein
MSYKLTPEQRAEVNSLMEAAETDLEGVIFQLVGRREQLAQALQFVASRFRDPRYGCEWADAADDIERLLSNTQVGRPSRLQLSSRQL